MVDNTITLIKMETKRLRKLVKAGETLGALPFIFKNSELQISTKKCQLIQRKIFIFSQIFYTCFLAVNTILLAKGKSRGGSKALDFDVCLSMTVAMGIMTVLQVLTIVKKKQGCILVNGYIRFTKKFHGMWKYINMQICLSGECEILLKF